MKLTKAAMNVVDYLEAYKSTLTGDTCAFDSAYWDFVWAIDAEQDAKRAKKERKARKKADRHTVTLPAVNGRWMAFPAPDRTFVYAEPDPTTA